MKYLALLLFFFNTKLVLANDVWVVCYQPDDFRLTKQQVRQIYLGKSVSLNGYVITKAVSLNKQSDTRRQFNAKILGLTESRLQSYWAHMKFSGRSSAPKEVQNVNDMLHYLKSTPGSIGYVPANTELPDNITVVFP